MNENEKSILDDIIPGTGETRLENLSNASLDSDMLAEVAVNSISTYEISYMSLLRSRMISTLRSEGFTKDSLWVPQFEVTHADGWFCIVFLDKKSANWFKAYYKREVEK